jgi:hypothetical protein
MTSRITWVSAAPGLINRRSLLLAGAGAVVAPLVAGAVDYRAEMSAAAERVAQVRFHKVLFDRDHAAAVAFGRAGRAAGLPVEPIGADLTALWYELSLRLRQGPTALAGLTTEPVGLYLQLLAQDFGLRPALRVSHTPLGGGRIRHYLTGPQSTLQQAGRLDAGKRWPLGALALLRGCPAALAPGTTGACTLISTSDEVASRERLVSWVMAPVARNRHGRDI